MLNISKTPHGEKQLLWLLAIAALVLFVMLSRPIWTNSFYAYDDFLNLHIPYRYLYSQALKSGESILWTPRFYCGYYIQGEGEAGFTHPLHWLLYKTLPLEVAFNLEFLLNYACLFAGMFVLLRRWRLERAPALIGALIFSFSGFSIMHFMHIHALGVVSQLPWVLLACDVLMCAKDLKHVALAQLAIALLTASQHLMGYPQFVVFCFIAETAVLLWRSFNGGSWRRLPLYALAVVFGFLIGAIQLVPTWDSLSASNRAETTLEFRTWFSMHPLNVIQLWAPFVLKDRYYATARVIDGNTHEMGLYATAFSTVALAWLAIRWRKLPQRGFVLATFLFGLFMLVMAFGKYGGVYLFVTQLPIIKLFPLRDPTRYAMLAQLAMALLAAFAFADLLALQRTGEKVPWRALWPLGVVLLLAASTAAVAIAIVAQPSDTWAPLLSSVLDILAGCALLTAAVGLVAAAARGARWGVYGIVLLTAAEIGVFNIWQYMWRVGPPQTLQSIVASLSPPPPPNTGRLCHPENDYDAVLAVAGYNLMRGYSALIPTERVPLLVRAPNGRVVLDVLALRLASVHWVQLNHQWLASPQPLPRARLVCQAVVGGDVLDTVPAIDLAATAIVDRKVDLQYGPPGTATIKVDRPGQLEIETTADTQQLLVISERYHSGWRATVDGERTAVLPAYGEYIACVVPAGTRHVALHFMPDSFVWGVRITLVSLAAAFLMAGGMWFWAKRHPLDTSTPM